jgi:hypothetical protein
MPKKGNNPRGVGSSIISILVFLMILFVPFLGVNLTQRVRSGDGKFDFKEDLCFDLNKQNQFDNSHDDVTGYSSGAFLWKYWDGVGAFIGENNVSVIDLPLNGTVDGYGVTFAKQDPGSNPPQARVTAPVRFSFFLNFTKAEIIDLDITRLDIYIDIGGVTFDKVMFTLTDTIGTEPVFNEWVSVGNLTEITVEVIDLLKINSLDENENLRLVFATENNEVINSNSFLVVDMQFYCIPEIVTPSLTKVSLYITATALFVIFMGFIVTPEISFDGIMKSIGKAFSGGN